MQCKYIPQQGNLWALAFGVLYVAGGALYGAKAAALIQLSVTDYLLFSMVDFVCVPQFVVPKKGFMLGFNMSGFLRWNKCITR